MPEALPHVWLLYGVFGRHPAASSVACPPPPAEAQPPRRSGEKTRRRYVTDARTACCAARLMNMVFVDSTLRLPFAGRHQLSGAPCRLAVLPAVRAPGNPVVPPATSWWSLYVARTAIFLFFFHAK